MLIPDEKKFYFVGGKVAGSLDELRQQLEDIDDDEFSFHVNSAKNDFANWVEGVLDEQDLAERLRHVLERKDTIRILKDHEEKRDEESASIPDIIPAPEDYLKFEEERAEEAPEEKAEEKPEEKPEEKFEDLPEAPEDVEEPPSEEDIMPPRFDQKEITDADIEKIVQETKRHSVPPPRRQDEKFIVKDFIYGFLLGLIFGVIMSGILFNLRGG